MYDSVLDTVGNGYSYSGKPEFGFHEPQNVWRADADSGRECFVIATIPRM